MQKLLSLSEHILFWGIFIILIFVPLFPKFPLLGVLGTFVSVRIEDLLIGFLVAVWSFNLIFSGKFKSFLKDKLNTALILFFFVGFVSVFSASFLTKTVEPHLGSLHYLRRIELILLLPIVITALKTKKQAYTLLFSSFLVLFIVNFFAFGQLHLSFPVVSTTTSELSKGKVYYLSPGDRVSSTFAGHYDLAVYLLMAITILVPVIYYFSRSINFRKLFEKKSFFSILALLGATIVSFTILVSTATRLSFVATIFGILIALVFIGKKKFILLAIILTALSFIYPSSLRDRFVSTFTVNVKRSFGSFDAKTNQQEVRSKLNIPTLPNSKFLENPQEITGLPSAPDITPGEPVNPTDLGVFRSFDIRMQVEWPRAIRAFQKNPFLGTGYSSISLATDNDLLRSLGEVGVLGTLAFSLVLIEAGKRIRKLIREGDGFPKYFAIGIFSMFLSFILNSLFIDVFEASKVATLFWILLGITVVLLNFNKNEKAPR